MDKLNQEERRLARSYEKGEWKSVTNLKSETRKYQTYVRETLRKSKRVNIRISPQDLEGMRRRAPEEGIPYQTLMASIIHKYLTGRLTERGA